MTILPLPPDISCLVTSVSLTELVAVPASAIRRLVTLSPDAARSISSSMAATRRAEKHARQALGPASLLVRVLGASSLRPPALAQASVGLTTSYLDVAVRYAGDRIRRKRREVRPLAATFGELPIDEIFELAVPEKDAEISMRFFQVVTRTDRLVKQKAPDEAPRGRRTELGSAKISFGNVMQMRAMQQEVHLDAGGVISVVMSVRGMYTLDELELLEWLEGADADLPTLKKCGVGSVSDLKVMSHSELLERLASARQSEETCKRITRKVMDAKALNFFPGTEARVMTSKILRHHQAFKPAPTAAAFLPSEPTWANTLCASALEPKHIPTHPQASALEGLGDWFKGAFSMRKGSVSFLNDSRMAGSPGQGVSGKEMLMRRRSSERIMAIH